MFFKPNQSRTSRLKTAWGDMESKMEKVALETKRSGLGLKNVDAAIERRVVWEKCDWEMMKW